MAQLDAAALVTRLRGLGSNRSPEYGLALMEVAGKPVTVYDLEGRPLTVRAENILTYVDKGFTASPPTPEAKLEEKPRIRTVNSVPPAPAKKDK